MSPTETKVYLVFAHLWAGVQFLIGGFFLSLRMWEIPGIELGRLPIFLIGIPHLVVAIGTWCRQRWSLWLGLAHTGLLPVTLIAYFVVKNLLTVNTPGNNYGSYGPGAEIGIAISMIACLALVGLDWLTGLIGFITLLVLRPFRRSTNRKGEKLKP